MEAPRIVHYPSLLLAGLSFFGNPIHSHAGWTEGNEIGRLWNRLMHLWQAPDAVGLMPPDAGAAMPPMPGIMYEIHLQHADTMQTGEYEGFVGFEIDALADLPLALCAKVLPASDYVLFTLRGEQIRMEEPFIDAWLATAAYEIAVPVYIQRYDERFKGLDRIAESELDFLIPVRRRVE